MVDADNNENLPDDTKDTKSKGNDALAATLAEVQAQLQAMNAQMQATQEAVATATRRPEPKQEEENLYDPETLLRRVENTFDTRYKAERAKDVTVFNLAQDYPEIQTDPKIRQAVLEAQRQIPPSIRDTAEGYEMAVLKAVSKAGLIPKSHRQTVDADASLSPRGGGGDRTPRKRAKVDQRTLEVAALMGVDIEDKERLKGLEEATNRDTFHKYR